MNSFLLLFLCKEEVLRIVAKKYDNTNVYSSYIPKMNLDIENPRVSRLNINFLEFRQSLCTNPDMAIIISPPNTMWDPKSFGFGFSNRMNIIGETPHMYTTIDPSNFDNISNQPGSIENEAKILEHDQISFNAKSIQQVI